MNMRVLILLIILCFVMKVCATMQGRYVVEVRLNGYSNPAGKCADSVRCNTASGRQRCCDSPDTTICTGDERCDSYFIYCLRPLGEVGQNPACYEDEKRGQSSANTNDGSLDFSQSTVLGLPNPRNLSIWHWEPAYKGIQVYIEVQDSDTNPDDLVDILLIDHNLTVAQSLRQNHTGMYNFVTMDLTITVICVGNFQGENCTQCVPGFTGSNCNERDHCFGVNCSGSGECMNNFNSFTCMCDRGYSGRLCENLNCFENNCSGNGQCLNALSSCNCSVGFTGRVCEININDCSSNPCGEGGQCVDGVNNFQCICDPGFTGELCQTNIDDCRMMGADCSGNGQCLDGVNNFTCNCTPGYSGPLCSEVIQNGFSDGTSTSVGAVVGGVFGVVLTIVILLILILVVVVILTVRHRNEIKTNYQGNQPWTGNRCPMPGDNPVYEFERGNATNGLGNSPAPQTTVTILPAASDRMDSSAEEREFDNPIYGDDQANDYDVYTEPIQDQQDHGSLPNHEIDNPIYGTETYDT